MPGWLIYGANGPFSHTARSMVDTCIRSGIHYLDITGEEDVLESIAQRRAEAQNAKVMLLPSAGFDVVPCDSWRPTSSGVCPRPLGWHWLFSRQGDCPGGPR
jgi:hypothetical protein